ncbi:MAG: hypothetical protein JOY62_10800 [Acidobacteriaceae bacterium]|nr:hypothetical protein [Acidobacteriaceae bacterium]MBV9780448.1 hypothetical protein [Acidobacteriaceae bacterium]
MLDRLHLPCLYPAGCLLLAMTQLAYGQVTPFKPVIISYTDSFFEKSDPTKPFQTIAETLAMRSDGSISIARPHVRVSTVPNSERLFVIRILDLESSRFTVVDQLTRSTTTYPSGSRGADPMFQISENCSGKSDNSILGFSVVRQDHVQTTPSRRFTSRVWRSAQLNCLPLRIEKTVEHTPAEKGTLEIRTANSVHLQSPPAWMFTVPSDFTERKPSEVFAEAARIKGGGGESGGAAAADKAYERSKAQVPH